MIFEVWVDQENNYFRKKKSNRPSTLKPSQMVQIERVGNFSDTLYCSVMVRALIAISVDVISVDLQTAQFVGCFNVQLTPVRLL